MPAIYYDTADINKVVAYYDPAGSYDASWPGMTKTLDATGTFVVGVPIPHHKIVSNAITEMSQAEKDARPLSVPSPRVPMILVGFGVSRSSVSQVQAAKGVASDSTGQSSIETSSVLTADLTVSEVGGLDTGSEAADTTYALHVIWGPGMATALLFSLSGTTPTLPTGYLYFRRLWWIRNGSTSNIWDFEQVGNGTTRRCWWREANADLKALSDGDAVTFTMLDLSAFMPPTARQLLGLIRFKTGSAGVGSDSARWRINGATSQVVHTGFGVVSNTKGRMPIELATDANQKIQYRVGLGGVNENRADLYVLAWDDEL